MTMIHMGILDYTRKAKERTSQNVEIKTGMIR